MTNHAERTESWLPHLGRRLSPLACAVLLAGLAQAEERLVVQLLDNPSFEEELPLQLKGAGRDRIPWWIATAGSDQLVTLDGSRVLETRAGRRAEQPFAAYAPYAADIRVRGKLAGRGRVVVTDGRGTRAVVPLADAPAGPRALRDFEFRLGDLEAFARRPPLPRLTLALECAGGATVALWDELEVLVPLPCPTEEELRLELLAELTRTFDTWLERGLDRLGPRHTGFLTNAFDARTGATLTNLRGSVLSFWDLLRDAMVHKDDPEWRAAYEAYLKDFLELLFHPETGLPISWDCVQDVPYDDYCAGVYTELAVLIDIIEDGPEELSPLALERARKIADYVVAHGVLPDGEISNGYWPATGRISTSYLRHRKLNVPVELLRLGVLLEEPSYRELALDALAQLWYTHVWSASWDAMDPGYDDFFGHLSNRALKGWLADPEALAYRDLVLSGIEYFKPIWRENLRLGGLVAADQIRCWYVMRVMAVLQPEAHPEIPPLLAAAARSHFKGQQYRNGAFGDCAIYLYAPNANLQMGDLFSVPNNLLLGLAHVYCAEVELRTPELRAMYTTVLRSSEEFYRKEYGYLTTRDERASANPAGGGVRLAPGMIEMLDQLAR